jgi:hypothetical protein
MLFTVAIVKKRLVLLFDCSGDTGLMLFSRGMRWVGGGRYR